MRPADVSYTAGLRAAWLRLEEYRAMKPLPSFRCRACDALAPGSLCDDCNERRLELKDRFEKFPMPVDVAESLDELRPAEAGPSAPRIDVSPRREWSPHNSE